MDGAAGEANSAALRAAFDHRLKLEFHGSRVTSDTLLQGSHGWHPRLDRGSRAALRLTRDARLALQAEPGPTPPHPGAEAQGHELARLRREAAPAWQLDGLVLGRGGRGVGGRAAHEPGRA